MEFDIAKTNMLTSLLLRQTGLSELREHVETQYLLVFDRLLHDFNTSSL